MLKSNADTFCFIIPAAGCGQRMGMAIPKQYLRIPDETTHNECVLVHVLNVFLSVDLFTKGIVVIAPDDCFWQDNIVEHANLICLKEGGETRSQSVLNACVYLKNSIAKDINPWVLVHDAARPQITKSMIINMCAELKDDEVGGILAMPVVDTVKMVDVNGRIIRTLEREQLFLAQTPQMFKLNDLIKALTYCQDQNIKVTDESSALESLGLQPRIILGDTRNFKITYPDDIKRLDNKD
ncbi:4-diphosphocytidyl-2C-methyl-D-erythritol synthase [Gammaproteobacteria bacterium]|nr:4-diphosphocytidyl-2C-methyl-D-erythritol synthase [Gammaproteobacteria bacterium]